MYLSDHSPVYCKFSLPDSEKTESSAPGIKRKIPSWKKATDSERLSFTSELETRLKAIDLPMNALRCRNVKCNNHVHRAQVDDLMSQLLSALEDTATETIPQKSTKVGKQKIPDWKEDVAPFKDNAHFWHCVWISAVGCSRKSLFSSFGWRFFFQCTNINSSQKIFWSIWGPFDPPHGDTLFWANSRKKKISKIFKIPNMIYQSTQNLMLISEMYGVVGLF